MSRIHISIFCWDFCSARSSPSSIIALLPFATTVVSLCPPGCLVLIDYNKTFKLRPISTSLPVPVSLSLLTMPAVSITCVAPDSPATAALKALIQTLDLTCKVTTEGSAAPCVTVTTIHALTGLKSATSATSWLGCARLLCAQVPSANLWGATSQETALVEAWMETASTTLIPVLLNAGAFLYYICFLYHRSRGVN
jgi:hypothetical protein